MTTIPSKEIQITYGLNTVERLIIGIGFMLFKAQIANTSVNSNYQYKDRVLIKQNVDNNTRLASINVEITFDLHSYAYVGLGYIKVKPFLSSSYEQIENKSFTGYFVPYDDINFTLVNSLEDLFVWACYRLRSPKHITIEPDYKNSTVRIAANLPLDFNILAVSQNELLLASQQVNLEFPDYSLLEN